jgi:hypothetical protein
MTMNETPRERDDFGRERPSKGDAPRVEPRSREHHERITVRDLLRYIFNEPPKRRRDDR